MNDKKYSVVYFGTPEFAVPALDKLYNSDTFELQAVVTQPDKKVGRKQEIVFSAVKNYALNKNLEVLQPIKIRKNEEFFARLEELQPDVIVVAAYGKIIPQRLLDIPKYGCINIHGSLLPKYRGASPIQACLLSGDTQTGVTIMLMDKGMDTGDMLSLHSIEISEHDTSVDLFKKLADLGAESLLDTLVDYIEGNITPEKQNNEKATYTSMIRKEDGQINWQQTAQQIYNQLRAFTPWPGVYTFTHDGKRLKIHKSQVGENDVSNNEVGTINHIDDSVFITCGENTCLELLEVQLEGKKVGNAFQVLQNYKNKKFA